MMQVPCPGIITQTLPKFQNGTFFCKSQVFQFRKMMNKSFVIRQTLFNTCLLQNHFRKPDVIRIGCIAPRKFPFVLMIPSKQSVCKIHSRGFSRQRYILILRILTAKKLIKFKMINFVTYKSKKINYVKNQDVSSREQT